MSTTGSRRGRAPRPASENIAAFLRLATAVSSTLDLPRTLQTACESAVGLLNVDHSGLVLFAADRKQGTVEAEYPEIGAKGRTVRVWGVPAEEQLIARQKPIEIADLEEPASEFQLGPVRELLRGLGVRSILIVPIISKGSVVGSFSLDSIGKLRRFTPTELQICTLFAAQVAAAVENARLFSESKRRAEELQRALLAIAATREEGELFQRLVEESARLVRATGGGLYRYLPECSELRVALDLYRPQLVGKALKLGEGLAGKMVLDGTPFRIEPDYRQCPEAAPAYATDRPFGSVLELLLRDREQVLGVLYVDREAGNAFATEDAETLRSLTQGALIALDRARRFARLAESERRLDLLRRSGDAALLAGSVSEGLERLAEILAGELDACFCRIVLCDGGEEWTVAAACARRTPAWQPRLREALPAAELPGLRNWLERREPTLLLAQREGDRPYLARCAASLALDTELQALLLVPLWSGDRRLGLAEVGDRNPDAAERFSPAAIEAAAEVAGRSAAAVYRRRLYEVAEVRMQTLQRLERASQDVRAGKDIAKVRQDIVRLAAGLVGGAAAALCSYLPLARQLKIVAVHNLPDSLLGTPLPCAEGDPAAEAVHSGRARMAEEESQSVAQLGAFDAMAAVPVKTAGEIRLILFVGFQGRQARPSQLELETLELFAASAGLAAEASDLIAAQQPAITRQSILYRLARYFLSATEQDKVLHAVLTAITAGYGLAFNRAAAFLLNDRSDTLLGTLGIGPMESDEVQAAWDDYHEAGMDDWQRYLARLEAGQMPPTRVGREIRGLELGVGIGIGDPFSQALFEGKPQVVPPEQLPQPFQGAFRADSPVAVVPLRTRDTPLGVLVADNKFTRVPIVTEDLELLIAFGEIAASALERARALLRRQVGLRELAGLQKTVQDFRTIHDPEQALRVAVDRLCENDLAAGATIILLDEKCRPRQMVCGGIDIRADIRKVWRPTGFSMEVIRSRQPKKLEDRAAVRHGLNRYTDNPAYVSSLGLPVFIQDQPTGVLWIHYRERQSFDEARVAALQLYADQAVAAYDAARRLGEQNRLIAAAEALARVERPAEVRQKITEVGLAVCQADACTFWSYDAPSSRWAPEEGSRAGALAPAADALCFELAGLRALEEGYACQEQLREGGDGAPPEDWPGSVQAVCLSSGGEQLGVLVAAYREERLFGEDEQRIMAGFARFAALALKRAELTAQASRLNDAAQIMAEVQLSEDVTGVLDQIAEKIRAALGCDAVSLYSYDAVSGQAGFPPGLSGVNDPSKVRGPGSSRRDSVVDLIARQDTPYVAAQTAGDPVFRQLRFTVQEGIRSCLAVPARLEGRPMAVLFVNYRREEHHFSPEEIRRSQVLAQQAAMAIRDAQWLAQAQRQMRRQQALARLSQEQLGSVSMREVLDRAVELAAKELGVEFCDIVLPQGRKLLFKAGYGWPPSFVDSYELEPGAGSHGGYTIREQRPVPVEDFHHEQRFVVPQIIREYNIRSGLGVPMRLGSAVVGAMLVHSRRLRQFGEPEIAFLSIVANQTAIAIQRAREYDELVKSRGWLALIRGLPAGAAGVEVEQMLREAMARIQAGLADSPRLRATLQLWDAGASALVLRSAVPPLPGSDIVIRVADGCWLCDGSVQQRKIGITGRAARDRVPQLQNDVSADPDYIELDGDTRAEMAVPVMEGEHLLGVLNVEAGRANAFGPSSLELLGLLAHLAAARLQQEDLESKLMAACRQLEEQQELLSVVSHELRAPLYPLQATIDFLLNEQIGPLNGAQKERLRRAGRSAEEAHRITMNLLHAGAPEAQLSPARDSGARVDTVVRELVERYQYEADRKKIRLHASYSQPEQLLVPMEEFRLKLVLSNLLSNALEFTSQGSVSVHSALTERGVEIRVEDTGAGIPAGEQERIFQKFYRRGAADAPRMGLGLYIARKHVEICGGDLTVQSETGQGSVFTVILPPRGERRA